MPAMSAIYAEVPFHQQYSGYLINNPTPVDQTQEFSKVYKNGKAESGSVIDRKSYPCKHLKVGILLLKFGKQVNISLSVMAY